MCATLDHDILDAPLTELSAAELPLAVLYRRRLGVLDEAEASLAALLCMAACMAAAVEHRSGAELLMFINGMGTAAKPSKRLSATAAEVGTLPNLYDARDTLVAVLDDTGEPITDGDGRLMIYSLKDIQRIAALGTFSTRTAH